MERSIFTKMVGMASPPISVESPSVAACLASFNSMDWWKGNDGSSSSRILR